ncbi:MAG: Arc family DNA-binding protein [Bacteroidetes bacterium]|nr:Arc family DNA-binding protein [Bacteroidota bacterium]
MAEKKNFMLRMDEELFRALEKWAADEFRSVNGQLEWIIHQKLKEAGRLKTEEKNQAGKGAPKNKK